MGVHGNVCVRALLLQPLKAHIPRLQENINFNVVLFHSRLKLPLSKFPR